MPHRNAPLTETGRLRLARCIVEHGWPIARAAQRFQVARTTATKWADRYRDPARPGWWTAPVAHANRRSAASGGRLRPLPAGGAVPPPEGDALVLQRAAPHQSHVLEVVLVLLWRADDLHGHLRRGPDLR